MLPCSLAFVHPISGCNIIVAFELRIGCQKILQLAGVVLVLVDRIEMIGAKQVQS